jgi:hypothetical protein
MERVETIAGPIYLARLKLVEKINLGQGFEGYFIFEAPGFPGELRALDEHYYADTEFMPKGAYVKAALRLLGGFDATRYDGPVRGLTWREVKVEWQGFTLVGPVGEATFLGNLFDAGGLPVHAHFMLEENVDIVRRARTEAKALHEEDLARPAAGDVVRVGGSMFVYMLKKLRLTCTGCGKEATHMTTSLPVQDDQEFDSVCLFCGHKELRNAFPDICDKCKKPMWAWEGKGAEVPLECPCGSSRYDFFYDHTPLFVEKP